MSELVENLRREFADEEYRYGYAESFLDIYVAGQIKALREQHGWEQMELAERLGTKQSAISRLEDVNYSSWSISTLKRLARVFGVRLRVSFEEFATLPTDVENFSTYKLRRLPFREDPAFGEMAPFSIAASKHPSSSQPRRSWSSIQRALEGGRYSITSEGYRDLAADFQQQIRDQMTQFENARDAQFPKPPVREVQVEQKGARYEAVRGFAS